MPQLVIGLFVFGVSLAMMIKADLGLAPWDVLNQGLSHWLPFSFGTITIAVGALVLLLWIPLRQWPGLGTLANAILVGIAADFGLWLLPTPEQLPIKIIMLVGGVVLNAASCAAYIGSQFGPGPRDGLMTGLARRTGRSIRLVRASIEVFVLALGFLLGGTVGVGTIIYAIGIGPLIQFFLPLVAVRLTVPERTLQPVIEGSES